MKERRYEELRFARGFLLLEDCMRVERTQETVPYIPYAKAYTALVRS
jgi:hypothetical protein